MSERRELVLVADDDEDIVRFVEVNLRLEGFDVATASDGEQALQSAYDLGPDLVLLDVMMPTLDGFEVCKRLRSDARTKQISVIMLTAKSLSADRVVGLTAGADDYMIKPFDPIELVARVRIALTRSRGSREVNPLTQLPGDAQMQEEVAERVTRGVPFAVLYTDLDNFKAFNDHYGFLRGDEAIKLLAGCSSDALREIADGEHFLGHIGGDDLVAIVAPDVGERVAQSIIERWDRGILELYDPEDVERGYIEIEDRRKQRHRWPITTLSIGIASNTLRPIDNHLAATEIAVELARHAKRDRVSSYAVEPAVAAGPAPAHRAGARSGIPLPGQ
jgi:diguanylate cyclase (GGDEF)-like protein